MNLFVITALASALFASVLALAREIRLRRALAKLLSLILSHWRQHDTKNDSPSPVASLDDRGGL
jgi:hypothetical protein